MTRRHGDQVDVEPTGCRPVTRGPLGPPYAACRDCGAPVTGRWLIGPLPVTCERCLEQLSRPSPQSPSTPASGAATTTPYTWPQAPAADQPCVAANGNGWSLKTPAYRPMPPCVRHASDVAQWPQLTPSETST